MYIRWVVRKHKNAAVADVTFYDAYLVESYRDERDTPRQRMVAYLGNIREIGGCFPAIERGVFFLRAERILAGMPALHGDERQEIMALLRQKVPQLTDDEVHEAFRNNVRWYFQWRRSSGRAPSSEELLRMVEEASGELGPM